MSDIVASRPARQGKSGDRLLAIVEVVVAFALTHVAYRVIKQFTVIGQWDAAARSNFTPGAVMVAFTVLALLVCRRSFAAYGLGTKQWPFHLSLGLASSLILLVFEAAGLALTHLEFDPSRPPDPHAPISPLHLLAIA